MSNVFPDYAPASMTYQGDLAAQRNFITKVFGWMSVGLLITAITALLTANSPPVIKIILSPGVFIVLLLVELGMVIGISAAINRIPAIVATLAFAAYAALNGLTLSFILLFYTSTSVASTFFVTAGTFGVMAAYGYVTKTDLTRIGNLCLMALIGLILASVVNIFLHSTGLYWLVTYAGILIFVGLVAYDTQKIKYMYLVGADGSEAHQKAAVLGALSLYLDFINLFLLLLRLFGRRR